MKYASKIAYFLLLVAFCNISFGMRRMVQTRAFSTATKTSPSFYNRMQQIFTGLKTTGWNFWNNITNRPSKAPAITTPQSIILQQPQSSISKISHAGSVNLSTPTDQEVSVITQLDATQTLSAMK